MNDYSTSVRRINIESFIWIVYIFLVCFNLYSNYLEKLYLKTHNKFYRKKFRNINKIVLTVILIIYIYFLYVAYKEETTFTRYKTKEKRYKDLILVASILFLIGGTISLYVATTGDIDDEELPLI